MRCAGVWAAALVLAAPAVALAADGRVVGVAPIGGDADGQSRAEATAALERALDGLEGLKVVSLKGLGAVLGPDAQAKLQACEGDDDCVRRAVAAVRTEQLVLGTLDKQRTLRLRLVDTATSAGGGPRVRVSRGVGYTEVSLLQEVTTAALELFPELADAAYGTISMQGGLPGAQIMVDGEPVGALSVEAPPRAAVRVRAGERKVRVVAPGHAAFEATLEVRLGHVAELEVGLSKNRSLGPLYLAGGALVAAGVATGLAVAASGRASDWEQACPIGMPCAAGFTRARYERDDDFVTGSRWAANGLFVAAGAAAIGAVVWYFLDPGSDEEAQ